MTEFKLNRHITDYLNSLYGDNKSDNTTKNYEVDLKLYQQWCESEGLDMLGVELTDLNSYKVYLRDYKQPNGKPYADTTVARRIVAVREFYRYLRINRIISENPADGLTIPKTTSNVEPIYLTLKEAKKLLSVVKDETHEVRDRAILTLFLNTGLRISELSQLNKSDINRNVMIIRSGKGNKQRKIILNQLCLDVINDYINTNQYPSEDALFTSQKNNRLSVNAIRSVVEKYVEKAKLSDKLTPHGLRHSYAVIALASKQIDLRVIQENLGHASLSTTQIYTHVLDESLTEASDIMGSMFS